jgi:fatty-acyl-CoA synthase
MAENFCQILQAAHAHQPQRVALTMLHAGQADQPVSLDDLLRGAAAYADALQNSGIQPGEVVILILQHSRELISAYWGAILAGAVPSIMPFLTEKLDPARYRADLTSLVGITRPSAIITYPEFEEEVKAAIFSFHSGEGIEGRGQGGQTEQTDLLIPLPEGRGIETVRAILSTAQIPDVAEINWSSRPGLWRDPQEIVLLQHSSGTTGLQKGVALSHQAVLNQLHAYGFTLHLDDPDVIVSWLPLYHDMGLIAGFILPILLGVPLVLMSPFDWVRAPYRLMHAVTRYRGTLTWLPNFAYNFCAQKIRPRDLEGVDLSSLRMVINCSEPMRWESHQAFIERFEPYGLNSSALATCYAMAENVFAVTQGGIDSPVLVDEIDREALQVERIARPAIPGQPCIKMLSAGRPIIDCEVKVVDDAGNPLSDRTIGELAVRSSYMLTGYYNRPDATEKALRNGWYLTGDLGYMLDGEVFISGRKKDLIIVGGKNVYPQDLERLAMEVPGVHPGRVVAFGVYNEASGTEEVVIVAEADETGEDARITIADSVRQNVTRGSAIALRHVHMVDAGWILKTSSGKTARLANREKYLKEMETIE